MPTLIEAPSLVLLPQGRYSPNEDSANEDSVNGDGANEGSANECPYTCLHTCLYTPPSRREGPY